MLLCVFRNPLCCFSGIGFSLSFIHPHIQNGDENQRNHCGQRQTEDNRNGKRLHHFGAFARCQRHRHHTQNGCQRCHEDGAQTARPCTGQRVIAVHAAIHQLIRIVYQNDTVIYYHTNQHDKAHHGRHGDGIACNQETDNRTRNRQRHGEHHDEGIAQGFKLGCHNHVYQQNRYHHCNFQTAEGIIHFFHHAAELIGAAIGQLDIRHGLLYQLLCLTGAHVIGIRADGNIVLLIFTHDGGCTFVHRYGSDIAQRNLCAVSRGYGQIIQIRQIIYAVRIIADNNVDFCAVQLILGCSRAGNGCTQRAGNRRGRDAVLRCLCAVNRYLCFGNGIPCRAFHIGKTIHLRKLINQLILHINQRCGIVAIYIHRHIGRCQRAHCGIGGGYGNIRTGDIRQQLFDIVTDLLCRTLSVLCIHKVHGDGGGVCAGAEHTGANIGINHIRFRDILQAIQHLKGGFLCGIQIRTVRQVYGNGGNAFIHARHEVHPCKGNTAKAENEYQKHRQNRFLSMAQCPFQQLFIFSGKGINRALPTVQEGKELEILPDEGFCFSL